MRTARQLTMTPAEWAGARRRDRERALRGVLRSLEASRREPWYLWIVDRWRPYRQTGDRSYL